MPEQPDASPPDLARQVDEPAITDDQRARLYEIVRLNPYVGFKTAARRAGIPGTGKQVKDLLATDPDFQDVLHEARGDMFEQAGLGVVKLLGHLGEIASKDGPSQLRAVTEGLALQGIQPRQRIEVTGDDGGPVEVNNPDVAAAVDRFTALADAAIRAASRDRTEPPTLDP